MDKLKRIKEVEDEVLKATNGWPHWKRAIAYRYLFNLGIRINDVDRIISLGLKDEENKPPIGLI